MAIYRVRTIFTGVPGTPWYSNLYFTTAGGSAVQAQQAVTDFWFELRTQISDAVFVKVESDIATLDETTGDIIANSPGSTTQQFNATGAGERLPLATQGLLRTRTGAYVNSREIRGRVFVPGLVEDANTSGAASDELIAAMNLAGGNLIADANSVWCVWAKTSGSIAVVNAVDAWEQLAVMRSRRD